MSLDSVAVSPELRRLGATVLAWLVIGLQAVSFVLGLVAFLSRRGRGHSRRFGLAAVVLSLLANPLLLVGLFSLLRGSS